MCRRTKWYISRFGEIIRVPALLDKEIVAYSRHVQSILTAWIQLTLTCIFIHALFDEMKLALSCPPRLKKFTLFI
jgi:hypothetical protein